MHQIIEAIVGNMFSGKTDRFILRVNVLRQYGRKEVLVVKPSTDTRSGMGKIRSRSGNELEAFEIPKQNPWKIVEILKEEERRIGKKIDVVAVDEIQFFPIDSGFFQVASYLIEQGYGLVVAGLLLDFRGEPFGSTPLILALPRIEVQWLRSHCTQCGEEAPYPQRIIKGVPAHYEDTQELVGDTESYEARCAKDFILPGRPWPPKHVAS